MGVKVERQKQILETIRKHKRTTIAELGEHFAVSDITIRRDLKDLEDQGVVQRAHGGVVYVSDLQEEPPIVKRQHEQQDAKLKIASAAAELVHGGDSIFIGSGSTSLFVARKLKERRGITVVTNALTVVNELSPYEDINVVVLGGMLRPLERSMIGHLTQQALREVRVDKVIMGIRGIDPEAGLTNDYMPEVMTDRTILEMGSQVILVADYTKLGRIASAFVAPISRLSTLVTDDKGDRDILARIEQMGVNVVIAT